MLKINKIGEVEDNGMNIQQFQLNILLIGVSINDRATTLQEIRKKEEKPTVKQANLTKT